ncbi:Translation initiation factor 2 [hydrothermal vent metagenome]|uniref:Translation initiation factor 2 n=1 Tax=hydrothermal vent metagenome TaxID=652676 RepID=A0A3B0V3Z3_9ZZZZ
MSEVTVKQLAEVLGIALNQLIEQLGSAGISIKSADDTISNEDKRQLLAYLRNSHGKDKKDQSPRKKVVLKRKSTGTLKISSGTGVRSKTKMVNIEVRKKRTFNKPNKIELDEIAKDRQEAQAALNERKIQLAQEEDIRLKAQQQKQAEQQAKLQAANEQQEQLEKAQKEEQVTDTLKPDTPQEVTENTTEEHVEKPVVEVKQTAKEKADQAIEEQVQRQVMAAVEKRKQDKQKREEQSQGTGAAQNKGKSKANTVPGRTKNKYGRKQLHIKGGKRNYNLKPDFKKAEKHGFTKPVADQVKTVAITDSITVADLAKSLAIKSGDVIKELMGMGMMVTINQILDQDTAVLVVEELGHIAQVVESKTIAEELHSQSEEVDDENAVPRPPVVTVMGHVDHGKTSLLDYIRKTKVTDKEAGGITQHIGAYHVTTDKSIITFIDTPGHAAFTAMRMRGAKATDIVILVVAANDGVMPQTIEAVKHAKAAGVPIIVAVNKMDLEGATIEKAKLDLSSHDVIAESFGGDVQFIPVSALTGLGIDELLEAISLQAEVMELKAVVDKPAKGIVVESSLDKGKGPVATVLVKSGTLRKGDMVLSGEQFGRARRMLNELGEEISEAGPSIPVVIQGLSGVPVAGEDFLVVKNEKRAKSAATERKAHERDSRLKVQQAAKLENLLSNMGKEEKLVVNLLIKADVQGSVEALKESLTVLGNDDVEVRAIATGVGGITNADAQLALSAKAIIIGFNVRADKAAREVIKQNNLDLHYFSIIYEAIDNIKAAITGFLGTETKEVIIGTAEVKDVFRSSKFGSIAGCIVLEGTVKHDNPIRVIRDNVVIFEGELESLRRHKDDVKEVKSGTECGIGVKGYNDINPGDEIECYERVEVQKTLD